MTEIEKRANDAYTFCEKERENAIGRENTGGWYFPSVYRSGYTKGATEQIELAKEWLKNNYGHFDGKVEDFVADFEKAMKL